MTTTNRPAWLDAFVKDIVDQIIHLGTNNEDEEREAIDRFRIAIMTLKWVLGVLAGYTGEPILTNHNAKARH